MSQLFIRHGIKLLSGLLLCMSLGVTGTVSGARLTNNTLCLIDYVSSYYYDLEAGKAVRIMRLRPDRPSGAFVVESRPLHLRAAHGHRQAYVEEGLRGGQWAAQLRISSPTEGINQQFNLDQAAYLLRTPDQAFVWASDSTSRPAQQLIWGPDGKYILLIYFDFNTDYYSAPSQAPSVGIWHYSLFGVDGTAYQDFMMIPQVNNNPVPIHLYWTSDGRLMLYPNYTNYYPGRVFPPLPQESAGEFWVVVPTVEYGNHNFQLDIQLSSRRNYAAFRLTPPFDGPTFDDLGDPSWSPDGNWVATVWASGQGTQRELRLSWAKLEANNNQLISFTLDDHFWDIRDLTWLLDSKSLAYVAQRQDGMDVEIADLRSGATRVVRNHMAQIAQLHQDPDTGYIIFWYRDFDSTIGLASYAPDGKLMHEFHLHNAFPGLEVELFHDPYHWTRWHDIYPSPDGKVIAFVQDRGYFGTQSVPVSVELVADDGSWSKVVYENVPTNRNDNFTKVVWSADSQNLLFAGFDQRPKEFLHIVNRDTGTIYTTTQMGQTPTTTWCPWS